MKQIKTILLLWLALAGSAYSQIVCKGTAQCVGTLSAADAGSCATAGGCVTLYLPTNAGAVALDLGAGLTGTAVFEATASDINGGSPNWVAISGTPTNSSTTATSATAAGEWRFAVSGMTGFRVRCSPYTSGSASATVQASTTAASLGGGGGGGANPAGSGSEVQFRSNGTTFGAVTGSSVSGANVTLGGTVTAASLVATGGTSSLLMNGSTSGTLTVVPPATASGTVTMQNGPDTVVNRASTDTFTNKTFDTGGAGNTFKIAGTSITAIAGNTGTVATTTGAMTSARCVDTDANGNLQITASDCNSATTPRLDQVLDPTNPKNFTMGANTLTHTFNAATGSGVSMTKETDTTNNTGTGPLKELTTTSGSAAFPLLSQVTPTTAQTATVLTGENLKSASTADSTHNYYSPSKVFTARYWNGSVDSLDTYTISDQCANSGTNPNCPLTFTHAGSTGNSGISLPNMALGTAAPVGSTKLKIGTTNASDSLMNLQGASGQSGNIATLIDNSGNTKTIIDPGYNWMGSGTGTSSGTCQGFTAIATAALTAGQVVKWDAANDNSVIVMAVTDTGGGIAAGIVTNSPGAAGVANVCQTGVIITPVVGTGTCGRGQYVIADTTTAGRVQCTSTPAANVSIGKVMAGSAIAVGSAVRVNVSTAPGGALTGTAPVTVSAAGAVGCATCATTTNGGALSGTAPVAISAAGAVSITGAAGQVLAGSSPAFTATPSLGVAGSSGGTLGLANGAGGGAVETFASAATTNYTVTGRATVPAQGDLETYSNGTGQIASIADVATGQALMSGGVGAVPAYTGAPSLTTSITAPTVTASTTLNAGSSNQFSVNASGLVTKDNNLTTAGMGHGIILGVTSQKSETTTADANVLTVTPAAAVGQYWVSYTASVSAATSGVISFTLSWTDANGNAQSNIAQQLFQMGTAAPNTTFTTSAISNYYGASLIDVNNAAANIVLKWVGGGTTTAKVSAFIQRAN